MNTLNREHRKQLESTVREARRVAEEGTRKAECAYQHWHRMLFARFLAENDLPVAQTLPQIFCADDPVLEVSMLPETCSRLEELLQSLPREIFIADDSLGWVYQYWQADRKEAINQSESKIGADELPPVTQLFTEDYMVLFLLHNTLGAWWAGKVLARNANLGTTARTEEEVRAACAVGDVSWSYLRLVRDAGQRWAPASGMFDGWPKAAKDISLLDPCMGSGFFLVAALPILAALRACEEGLTREAAFEAVLRDNLCGLELDQRCSQIATFNLAMAAWKSIGYRKLPPLQLACSGLSPGVTKEEWLRLAERAAIEHSAAPDGDRSGFEREYELFSQAPVLGSLIQPRAASDRGSVLATVLARAAGSPEPSELAVAAQGLDKAAEILASRFTLVVTNVPYLGRGKQHEVLRHYCEHAHPAAKADLATCFVERCVAFTAQGGSTALVTPQNWLFLGSYKRLRKHLLEQAEWNAVARLGPRAFETITGEVVNVALVTLTNRKATPAQQFAALDSSGLTSAADKAAALRAEPFAMARQHEQLRNPDFRIAPANQPDTSLLASVCNAYQGLCTSDDAQFIYSFWELPEVGTGWRWLQSAGSKSGSVDGCSYVLHWEDGGGRYYRHAQGLKAQGRLGGWKSGGEAWGRIGLAINVTRNLFCNLYLGEFFDNTIAAVIPADPQLLAPIHACVTSADYAGLLRAADPSLSVTEHTLLKIPFDLACWQEVAARNYPIGLLKPHSDDPVQWLFNGHPKDSDAPLQVAVARLVGYRWPRQTGSSFPDCPASGPDGLEAYAHADGVVSLTPINSESAAARSLIALLAESFGDEWSAARLTELLANGARDGTTLEEWLRDHFFEEHCEIFQQRPFVWHIWDGRRDGFNVLVNYHKLAAGNGEGERLLSKLTYSLLGDWIDGQRAAERAGVRGSDARLAAAEHLKGELEKILEGDPPYDLFVRWKKLSEQPVGWAPDINDGVRINIRPFMTARPLAARGKNACILRVPPRIKWNKDRGKEPERQKQDYPWFWSWDGASQDFAGADRFDGNRWNGLHYTPRLKLAARKISRQISTLDTPMDCSQSRAPDGTIQIRYR